MGGKMPLRGKCIVGIVLVLSLCACGRPPADASSSSADSQSLPFDRPPKSSGLSPSQSLMQFAMKVPEGTPIPVRLRSALSSASAQAGDSFYAILDEPIVIDGQTMVASGATATGRVLEAMAYAPPHGSARGSSGETGYLRVTLVSLNAGGRAVAIETSSIFAKGGSREERSSAAGAASPPTAKSRGKDVVLGIDRHLNFRLTQSVDLQQ